jgi:hypothetical protein
VVGFGTFSTLSTALRGQHMHLLFLQVSNMAVTVSLGQYLESFVAKADLIAADRSAVVCKQAEIWHLGKQGAWYWKVGPRGAYGKSRIVVTCTKAGQRAWSVVSERFSLESMVSCSCAGQLLQPDVGSTVMFSLPSGSDLERSDNEIFFQVSSAES